MRPLGGCGPGGADGRRNPSGEDGRTSPSGEGGRIRLSGEGGRNSPRGMVGGNMGLLGAVDGGGSKPCPDAGVCPAIKQKLKVNKQTTGD